MLSREEMECLGAAQGELSKVERFAVDALRAFRNHPIMKLIDESLMFIAERIENPFLTDEQAEILQRAARVVRAIQTEAIPAAYALTDTMVRDRMDVLERYREEVLDLPGVFRPRVPLRVSGDDPWRYAPAVWEALNEKRWIAADSPTKYISVVATSKLEQRQAEEEREHADVRREGGQLVSIEEVGADEEVITEATSGAEPVMDLCGLPIPEEIITCVNMARKGRKWEEIAAHLGTDTRHLIEKVRRTIEKLPPNIAAVLKDRTNYTHFAPSTYVEDVAILSARMRAHVITKRPIADMQKPDPTRANATGQGARYTRVWLNNFNEKVCGNSGFYDTNSMER